MTPTGTSAMAKIFGDIIVERVKQVTKWGGEANDDRKRPDEWYRDIQSYLCWARLKMMTGNLVEARQRAMQVAALAVAWVERLDRAIEEQEAQERSEEPKS